MYSTLVYIKLCHERVNVPLTVDAYYYSVPVVQWQWQTLHRCSRCRESGAFPQRFGRARSPAPVSYNTDDAQSLCGRLECNDTDQPADA